jgi:hypothetical protein
MNLFARLASPFLLSAACAGAVAQAPELDEQLDESLTRIAKMSGLFTIEGSGPTRSSPAC